MYCEKRKKFIDAKFKAANKGFKQIYNVMLSNDGSWNFFILKKWKKFKGEKTSEHMRSMIETYSSINSISKPNFEKKIQKKLK